MYIIVGLGNPGKKYAGTRHNAGFEVLDNFAEKHGIKMNKIKFKGLLGEGRIQGKKVLLLKPQTFMNLSGHSVREIVEFYKIEIDRLIVVYDDIDTPLGRIRIRKNGSAGTHNGMKDIIYNLMVDEFPRVRVGIGLDGNKDIIGHVLGGFAENETKPIRKTIAWASEALETIVIEGVDKAMNKYNAMSCEPGGEDDTESR
jgi:PTH1 family peptidyl-tRNA hydrolase